MNPTRGTAALDYIERASADLANSERVLSYYIELARQYGCSDADIARAGMITPMATRLPGASDRPSALEPRPEDA